MRMFLSFDNELLKSLLLFLSYSKIMLFKLLTSSFPLMADLESLMNYIVF